MQSLLQALFFLFAIKAIFELTGGLFQALAAFPALPLKWKLFWLTIIPLMGWAVHAKYFASS